ncbi:MAG TPA: hypothetical protein VF759_07205 [Allosphingosinicella sp.]|jgi:hypothetical protein
MTQYERTSKNIARYIADAFHWVINTDEKRAFEVLDRAAKLASVLAEEAKDLATQFHSIAASVQKSQHATLEAAAFELHELDDIRRKQADMTALLALQKSRGEELTTSIATLNTLYEDAKSRENTAQNQAFITGLVSGVAGAMGSAFGGYAAAKNPLGAAAGNLTRKDDSKPDSGSGSAGSGSGRPAGPSEQDKAVLATARADAAEADAAQSAADRDYEAKKKAVDDAGAAGGEPTAEETAALGAASSARTAAREKAKTSRKTAEDLAAKLAPPGTDTSVEAGIAAGLGSASASAGQSSAAAQGASDSIREEKMKLLDIKLKQEADKRDSVNKMTELTSRLSASAVEQKVHDSAQAALQIAVYALSAVGTTLGKAEQFWNNVAAACKNLDSSDIKADIDYELKNGGNEEHRRTYYLSDRFLSAAVGYLANWAALASLSGEYKDGAIAARDKTVDNINAAPTVEEGRNLLQPLKERIKGEFAAERAASERRTAAVKAQRALISAG